MNNQAVLSKIALAVGVALTAFAGQSIAAPAFGINQAASGGTYLGAQNVTGSQFGGTSSELLTFSNGDQNVAVNFGYLQFSSISNTNVNPTTTTLIDANSGTGTYGLYLTFSFMATYAGGGAAGTAGSNYTINNLSFALYSDPTGNTTFSSASGSTQAAITGGGSDDILLGFGTLAQPGSPSNVAGFNSGGGAFVNSLEAFAICSGNGSATVAGKPLPAMQAAACKTANGTAYFASPSPFYSLAFDAFNNTGNSLSTRSGNNLAITQAVGAVTFQVVPEPSTVALFGIAAVGLGLSTRRRRKSA